MSKWLIGIGVSLVSAALGVAAAYGGVQVLKAHRLQNAEAVQTVRESDGWGICGERPADRRTFDRMQDRRGMFRDWMPGIENPER
jgi:hypothetical protein